MYTAENTRIATYVEGTGSLQRWITIIRDNSGNTIYRKTEKTLTELTPAQYEKILSRLNSLGR